VLALGAHATLCVEDIASVRVGLGRIECRLDPADAAP
jgi:hypothetical protein